VSFPFSRFLLSVSYPYVLLDVALHGLFFILSPSLSSRLYIFLFFFFLFSFCFSFFFPPSLSLFFFFFGTTRCYFPHQSDVPTVSCDVAWYLTPLLIPARIFLLFPSNFTYHFALGFKIVAPRFELMVLCISFLCLAHLAHFFTGQPLLPF